MKITGDMELIDELLAEDIEILEELIKEDIQPIIDYRKQQADKAFEKEYKELRELEGEA